MLLPSSSTTIVVNRYCHFTSFIFLMFICLEREGENPNAECDDTLDAEPDDAGLDLQNPEIMARGETKTWVLSWPITFTSFLCLFTLSPLLLIIFILSSTYILIHIKQYYNFSSTFKHILENWREGKSVLLTHIFCCVPPSSFPRFLLLIVSFLLREPLWPFF